MMPAALLADNCPTIPCRLKIVDCNTAGVRKTLKPLKPARTTNGKP